MFAFEYAWLTIVWVCSAAEYAAENGGKNYGSQFKNLGKLVENVNKEILHKLDGSSAASSSNQPSRYSICISFILLFT